MYWGLTGPEFLALYWIALGATIVVGIWLNVWRRSTTPRGDVDLDPYGVALLSGGWRRVGDTALAGLTARGQVHVSRSGGVTLVPDAQPADPFEASVLGNVRTRRSLNFSDVAYGPAAVDLRRRMAEAGYLLRHERAKRAGKLGWVFLILLGVGLARVITGLLNDLFVGFTVLSLIATVVAWIAIVGFIHYNADSMTPTRRGFAALAEARRNHRDGGVALAVGAAVLLPVAFAGLGAYPDQNVSQAFAAGQQTGSSSSGTVDSGDGGGCGGCGGCG